MKMKNSQCLYHTRQTILLFGLLVFSLNLMSGCDGIGISNKDASVNTTIKMDFNAEFRYMVGYDQKTWSFTTLWPTGMVGSLLKESSNDDWLLDRYELIREKIAFDADGRMYTQNEWLDGDADHTLPLSIYEQYKDFMPTHGDGHDPVVKSLFGGGQLRYITKSGKTAYSYPIDPNAFRIDPAVLEELLKQSQNQSGASERRADISARLQSQGISFRELDSNHLVYSTSLNDGMGIGKTQFTIDTRTGQVVHAVDFREDGNIDSIALFQYKTVNGIPVMEHSNTIQYGMRNGQWIITGRTLVNRENIQVFIQ